MDRSSVGSSDREQADAGLAKFMLEWRIKSALDSLNSHLTGKNPSLNHVECFLYISRTALEQASTHQGIRPETVEVWQRMYDTSRAQAFVILPLLSEYGLNRVPRQASH